MARSDPAERRWWRQDTVIGTVTVVVGPRGIERLRLPPDDRDALPGIPERVEAVAAVLDAWSEGRDQDLDLPVDLSSLPSGFRRHVLETLRREVGWGETITYGELAALAGAPGAARAVGTTMAQNPVALVVPCHRVVASGGRLGGYGGGEAMKRALLAREGSVLL